MRSRTYRDGGGRLMYLGGNGFYWRVALHQSEPGAIEIRSAPRAASAPGRPSPANITMPSMALMAGYGGETAGLRRRSPASVFPRRGSSKAPITGGKIEKLTIPKSAGSFQRHRRRDPRRFRPLRRRCRRLRAGPRRCRLGTPDNVRILASSEGHGETFVLVPEEQLTHITNWPNEPEDKLLRADMVYFDVPGGGAVFSTGSITFCGSLPWNDFDNNISTLVGNVLDRFLDR